MKKVLSINRYTGIDLRSSVGTPDHPVVNQAAAPSIAELHHMFISDGVPMAVTAARKALAEAGIEAEGLTHMVSTTCTDSANPGFDHVLARELGIASRQPAVEKVLLHGVGCAGGLAALRTAAGLALGHAARGKPARVLVVALEISTTMVRSELDSINALQETRIGVCLFSDCASAVVLSNGIRDNGLSEERGPVYDLLSWDHKVIPDTEEDLGFDVDPVGWKVVLSPRVPRLTAAMLQPAFADLLAGRGVGGDGHPVPLPACYREPADFDWAMHPGGATILSGAERALGLAPEHMRASYDTYINHGNSSSATIFSVLDRLRQADMDALTPGGREPTEYVIGCAFGPGIAVETCLLRRRGLPGNPGGPGPALGITPVPTGLQTPPETESEGSSRGDGDEDEDDEDGGASTAAQATQEVPTASGDEDKMVPTIIGGHLDDRRVAEDDSFISEALDRVELD